MRILSLSIALSLLAPPALASPFAAPVFGEPPGTADAPAVSGARPSDSFTDGKKAFDAAMKELLAHYVDEGVTEDDLYRGAAAGMLQHAGERSWDQLLPPSTLRDMTGSLAGEVVGIGVEIKFDKDSGMAAVRGVIPGSAAERAGLVAGDQILRVDGKGFKGRDMREIIDAIRGKAGAEVALTVLHEDKVFTRSIRRERVAVQTVGDDLLADNVGVLWIGAFNEKTPEVVKASLARLASRHARGLVVDLRGCPGGLFERALDVASMLLPDGATVVTEIARGGERKKFEAKGGPVLKVPIAVLVDNETASGGEILAGALKAAGAKVIGKKTLGKWNVQMMNDLPNGWAIKYTVGVFETPSGERLDGIGLLPDLEVEMDPALREKARRADPRERLSLDAQLRVAVSTLGVR